MRYAKVGKLGRRLPTTFRVGNQRWKLKWEKPSPSMLAYGYTDWSSKTVCIDPDLDDELLMSTLVDEAGHASLGQAIDNDAMGLMSDTVSILLTKCGFKLEEE